MTRHLAVNVRLIIRKYIKCFDWSQLLHQHHHRGRIHDKEMACKITFQTKVSNGTRFSCLPGQRDISLFVVPGQRDNMTEVPSLSRDKGTTGQAQNLAVGQDWPGQPAKIRDRTRDGTITIFLSKSGTGHRTGQSLFFCQNPVPDRDGTGQSLFFPLISWFTTSTPYFSST